MAQCDVCGQNENMPYQCRMCGGTFCAEHRLPENHSCPGLDKWNDPEGVFDSGFDDSANNSGGRFSAAARTGGPLSYFRGNMTFVFLALMVGTFIAEIVVLNVMGDVALFDKLFVLQTNHIARVWTWVTSIFAHDPYSFFHILFNGIVLYFFGQVLERYIGSKKFTALFLGSGILAGLAQVGVVGLMGGNAAVLGASGAIMAVMGVLTVLNPNMKIYIYFILPVPLWVATIGFAIYSGFVSVSAGPGANGVAQLAHLTGLGIGLLYGAWLKNRGTGGPSELDIGGGGGRGGMGGGGRRRF
ncbi:MULTISPECIES: rhomboid family intramembrane serine protease [unclassified Haladaptatus]|uniref:rhomboid family intramembrane serine protease n=1 Tax=unclassified Haladaptatus TaxID=2622732 RepID=UPI00209BF15B|nr:MULTISPECIES: rhomboid family intramembrane serine protease [unclassified Haladaptatus]MCO8244266.1 rhomboid family intramembrane serine protease [Haladaptatus sp. AB643]MCO8254108.1 rhomboid family intramembrane serine protease [Haladaptatus sp. AB618]